ncbi:MAG: sugar phosphate nucleotidyltransferase [Marinifilaceae bacterium]|jgi:NDP-sugar pyrophosphorylase family protein|nr:sugar phosphate nucleotidyltransferase [Marinifilaceae bacterium]
MLNGLIFAAGLGSRLSPLTDDKPKALVEINGKSLLERAILKLKDSGVNRMVINVHYMADKIIKFLKEKDYFDTDIRISDEKEQLLETGGGLMYAKDLFLPNVPILIYNVDVITDTDLSGMLDCFNLSKPMALLAVRERQSSRYLMFNQKNELCAWKNIKTNEMKISKHNNGESNTYAFSGIQIISYDYFKYYFREGAYSIIESYLELAKEFAIKSYNHTNDRWYDIGKIDSFYQIEKELEDFNL